jgi:hypothetical protein
MISGYGYGAFVAVYAEAYYPKAYEVGARPAGHASANGAAA